MPRKSVTDHEEENRRSLADKMQLSVNASVLRYALALEGLARTAKQKGVDDYLLYAMIDCAVVPVWRNAIWRYQWALDHIDAFRDESGACDKESIALFLGDGKV